MNKKRQYQILLLVLVAIVIFNLAIILTSTMDSPQNSYNITEVGKNSNGTVYKIVAGNESSDKTIGIILGVHPREHEIHEAINKTVYNITHENGTHNLTKKYVIYYIKTKPSLTSREETRTAGEQLAHKFIVPNIKNDNPFLVIDVHEIDPIYEYSNFVFSLSDRNDKVDSYIEKISNDVGLVDYNFTEGTSPEKVTAPIAKKGINTILAEVCITDTPDQKQRTADRLVRCLDEINP